MWAHGLNSFLTCKCYGIRKTTTMGIGRSIMCNSRSFLEDPSSGICMTATLKLLWEATLTWCLWLLWLVQCVSALRGHLYKVSQVLAYWSRSLGFEPTRGRNLSNCNRAPLHTTFHYNPPIILIWQNAAERDIKSPVTHQFLACLEQSITFFKILECSNTKEVK